MLSGLWTTMVGNNFIAVSLIGVRLDALATVYSDDITYVTVSGIGVGMLAEVVVNVLAAVVTALNFIVSASTTDSVPFC